MVSTRDESWKISTLPDSVSGASREKGAYETATVANLSSATHVYTDWSAGNSRCHTVWPESSITSIDP